MRGAHTQDFNRRHRRTGHLFQGRYKALLVDKEPAELVSITDRAWDVCALQREIGRASGVSPYAVSKATAYAAVLAASTGTRGKLIRSPTSNLKG